MNVEILGEIYNEDCKYLYLNCKNIGHVSIEIGN